MRTCCSLLIIVLALLSRVSAEKPARVIATIPIESLIANNANEGVLEARNTSDDGNTRPVKDVEVTGFITKNGDIFEVAESRGIGSIESRQDPEPGMSMCRYGTIVVYSDRDCNTFFKPLQDFGVPANDVNTGNETEANEADGKPIKNKKQTKGSRRKPNRNKSKRRRKNNKRKNQVRRKALKQRGNKNRRRNNQKQKRRKNQPNKRRNQRRGNKKNVKRKRINNSEERSNSEPLQFAILYDRR